MNATPQPMAADGSAHAGDGDGDGDGGGGGGGGAAGRAHLLAVDWGTSSLRGAVLDAQAQVLHEHSAPSGLLKVAPGTWATVFDAAFGAWMHRWPDLRCLMAGMVGSRQGWVEVRYLRCPASLGDLAAGLHALPGSRVAIVPGLCAESDGVPDVMRGEETQVFGALAALNLQDATLVLPGTHSKWVRVSAGRILGFATHMTGECYALLRHRSLLARSLPAQATALLPDDFDAGVARAQQAGGLLHHLFGVRGMDLFGQRSDASLESYLSGLLIGEELRAQAASADGLQRDAPLVLVGAAELTTRYQRALSMLGCAAQVAPAQVGWLGLMALADAATIGR